MEIGLTYLFYQYSTTFGRLYLHNWPNLAFLCYITTGSPLKIWYWQQCAGSIPVAHTSLKYNRLIAAANPPDDFTDGLTNMEFDSGFVKDDRKPLFIINCKSKLANQLMIAVADCINIHAGAYRGKQYQIASL